MIEPTPGVHPFPQLKSWGLIEATLNNNLRMIDAADPFPQLKSWGLIEASPPSGSRPR